MSKRNIEKHILMNKAEAQDLQKKAKRACLSEGGLIRLLLRGYEPREKPDERFYDVMRELSAIGNNINQIAAKIHSGAFTSYNFQDVIDGQKKIYDALLEIVRNRQWQR